MAYTPIVFAKAESPSGTQVTSVNVSISTATSTGDTLVLCIGNNGSAGDYPSVSDSAGNSYTLWGENDQSTSGNPNLTIYYCTNAKQLTTSNSISVTWGSVCNYAIVCVDLPGSAVQDAAGQTNAAANGTTASIASGTLHHAYEVLLGVCATSSTADGVTWSSGNVTNLLATEQAQPSGTGGNTYCSVAYEITSATTAQTATATLAVSNYAVIDIACFELPPPVFPYTTLPAAGASAYTTSNAEATVYAGSGTYSITAGTLPGGITQNTSTGVLSGTATANGTFTFTVHVVDGNGNSASQAYSLTVSGVSGGGGGAGMPPISSGPYALCQQTYPTQGSSTTSGNIPVLQTGYQGDTYCIIVSVEDASTGAQVSGVTDTQGNTYTLQTVTSGVSGTTVEPEVQVYISTNSNVLTAGTDTITVTLSVSAQYFSVGGFGIVGAATLDKFVIAEATSTSVSVASGTLTDAYEYVIGTWTTGPSTTSWAHTAGPNTALESANPTAHSPWIQSFWEQTAATTSVTFSGTLNASTTWQGIILTFVFPPPAFGSQLFTNGIVGSRYSSSAAVSTVSAGSLTYALQAGTSLPPGLSLSTSTGVVTGIPTTVGSYTFVVVATDSNGSSAAKGGTITIGAHVYGNGTSNILPAVPNFVLGETSITNLNNLAYAVDFLIDDNTRPVYKAFFPYTYSVPATTWTTLMGGEIAFDSDGQGGSATNMQTVVNTTGVYSCEGCVSVKNLSTVYVFKVRFLFTPGPNNPVYTGTVPFGQRTTATYLDASAATDTTLCCSDICPAICYPGDTIALQVYTGAAMTVDYNNNKNFNQGRFVTSFTTYYLHVAG